MNVCPAVNNAGRNIRKATLDFTPEEYHTITSTNLESAFVLCQVRQPRIDRVLSALQLHDGGAASIGHCVTTAEQGHPSVQLAHPLLKAAGGGAIVCNSSVAGGPMAIKTGAVYAMTKGATRRARLSVSGMYAVLSRACAGLADGQDIAMTNIVCGMTRTRSVLQVSVTAVVQPQ